MDKVLSAIREADGHDIHILFHAALLRYREVNPDWEISLISIEKRRDKNQQLDEIIALLENMKE